MTNKPNEPFAKPQYQWSWALANMAEGTKTMVTSNNPTTREEHNQNNDLRASPTRSRYELLASQFAGSPAMWSEEEAGGGGQPCARHEPPAPNKLSIIVFSSILLIRFTLQILMGSVWFHSSGRINAHVKLEKFAESGSSLDGTLSVAGRVLRALARTPAH